VRGETTDGHSNSHNAGRTSASKRVWTSPFCPSLNLWKTLLIFILIC
jgi:hypothetical protein